MSHEIKHFTATAIIRNKKGEFLLHEHPKLGFWLPPGGHIEENEEPQEALYREVLEETGLYCKILSFSYPLNAFVTDSSHTQLLPLPMAILKEFIADKKKGDHWHIDMVYLCELTAPEQPPFSPFSWVPFQQLTDLNIPKDVIELAQMVNEYYQVINKA